MRNKYNVDEVFYYYLRYKNFRPVVTVCIVRKDSKYARGLAICSPNEMPVKKEGRRYSRDRALKALFNEKTSEHIGRFEALMVMSRLKDNSYLDNINYKSEYNPTLTVFEKVLMGLLERNMN